MMRTLPLIALSLLSLSAQAASTSPFQQPCLESQAIMASVQPSMATATTGSTGPGCHRGQLDPEDLAQMESVRPSSLVPRVPTVITGLSAHRGQLGPEDIAIIESVQPVGAIRRLDIGLN